MAFDRPPEGLVVRSDHDAAVVEVLPYLSDHGRYDLRVVVSAVGVAAAVWNLLALPWLAALVLVGAFGWLVAQAVRRSAREATVLTLRVGRDVVEVTETANGRVSRYDRVALRDIGRVETEEAGYERPVVVAHPLGRDALWIPMERHPKGAADWVARELADAGRAARHRQGGGAAEVPSELRRLTE